LISRVFRFGSAPEIQTDDLEGNKRNIGANPDYQCKPPFESTGILLGPQAMRQPTLLATAIEEPPFRLILVPISFQFGYQESTTCMPRHPRGFPTTTAGQKVPGE
jgi:hypothetical protein